MPETVARKRGNRFCVGSGPRYAPAMLPTKLTVDADITHPAEQMAMQMVLRQLPVERIAQASPGFC